MASGQKIENPLLETLFLYTKLYHKPYTKEYLVSGLPVEKGKTYPELFSLGKAKSLFFRAAQRAGLKSRLTHKRLHEISPLLLPVIVILNKNYACILTKIDTQNEKVTVIFPNSREKTVSFSHFLPAFSGNLFLMKKEFAKRSLFRTASEDEELKIREKHWFWDIVMLSKPIYADAVVASLLTNVFVLATPLFIMNIYDRVLPNKAFDTLWVLGAGLLAVYAIDAVVRILRAYFLELSAKKSDVIISSAIFEKILDMRMQDRPKSIGAFSSTVKDFDFLKNFLAHSTVTILVDVPFIFIFFFVLYFIAGNVVVIPLIIMLLIFLTLYIFNKKLQGSVEKNQEFLSYKQGILVENLVALETVKTLGSQKFSQQDWEEATGETAEQLLKHKMVSTYMQTIIASLLNFNSVAVIIAGVYLVSENLMSSGGLIAFMMLSRRALAPVGQVSSIVMSYHQAKASYERIDAFMQLDVEHPTNFEFIQKEYFRGKIEFQNVTFRYKGDKKDSLRNVSFTIRPKEKVALLGEIGSGKSTILKLVQNLYQPTSGSIYIDDLDINQINPSDLRKNIGSVPQDIMLFRGTIKENILKKTTSANEARILYACQLSGVDEIIRKHPLEYDMPISEQGRNVSSGQRQSIAIARIFLEDHPIIVLDEPTSSIDASLENKLIHNIKIATQNATLLLVTHKLSLLKLVDRIIVVDNGRIAIDDTKDKVLEMLTRGKKR